MTSERLSVETTIARSPGASDAARLRTTPDDEIALALRPNPRPVTTAGLHWIDPGFASLFLLANAANDLIRIGATDQIRKRFTAMNVASPVELRIVHFVHVVGPLVAKAIETGVHAKDGTNWTTAPAAGAVWVGRVTAPRAGPAVRKAMAAKAAARSLRSAAIEVERDEPGRRA